MALRLTLYRGELKRVLVERLGIRKQKNTRPWLMAVLALGLSALGCERAGAVSCATQTEMKDADRTALASAAQALASLIQTGNADGIKARTIPSVASNFADLAGTISSLAPTMQGASLRVSSVYALDAASVPAGAEEVQFFCGQAINTAHVTLVIPQLPAGRYAFVIVEATGVKVPQRLSMLLQNVAAASAPANWQLAGFFPRPLLAAGQDGVWYWEKARGFHKANQNWNSYFYYQTARYLLQPADFLSSNNLEKLEQEASAALPAGLPGQTPMVIQVKGGMVNVTNLHTDASLGGLDLVINYDATDVSDPVQARTKTVAVMKVILNLHPELKESFHGLWVFANAPNQQPFSLELPMAQIETQP